MKTNISIVLGLVAVIMATLAWTSAGTTTVIRETLDLGSGTRFPNGISADTTSPARGEVRGTSLTTTGVTSSQGGVTYTARSATLSTGTLGVICALQAPAATSTLVSAIVNLDTSTTSATTMNMAQGVSASATTTRINFTGVAANAQGVTLIASSTPTIHNANVFAPSSWLVVSLTGGNGTYSPTGSCAATWINP
jgi:hypothetical protein